MRIRFHQKKAERHCRPHNLHVQRWSYEGHRALGNAGEFVQLEWNVWDEERGTFIAQLTKLR